MASVSEIYINPDSQLSNNDINIGRCQLGLCVRINIPNGTGSLNNIWTQSGLPGGLKPNSYIFVNNNIGNCNIILPAIGTTSTTASFGHEMQINNDPASLGTITIQNSAFVNITVLQIGNAATLRAANTGTNTWNVFSPSVNSATPILQGIMYGLTQSAATGNTALGFQALNNYLTNGNNNTVIGYQAGINLNSVGSINNVIIGSGTGSGLSATPGGNNDNILIGNNSKFTTSATQSVGLSTVIGNNTLNFIASAPGSNSLSDSTIIGTNVGPRNNNAITSISLNGSTIIGNSHLGATSGFGYIMNDTTILGNNTLINLAFSDDLVVIGTDSLNNAGLLSISNSMILGAETCNNLTSGDFTTIIGSNTCGNLTTGSGNTVIGQASDIIGAGSNNVVIGRICNAGSGSNNIVLGFTTGTGANTGSNNIVIGGSATPGLFSNSICLGRSATATVSNQFVFGSAGTPINQFNWIAAAAVNYNLPGLGTALAVDTATGRIGISTSSRRYKENIISIENIDELNLLDITKLNPVHFNYIDNKNHKQIGLIAEDVDKAGFKCLVNYIPNVKTKTIEKRIPQPDIVKIKGDHEFRSPQPDEIINETVIDTDDDGNPIKLDDDYDDVCPDNINYQLLSVLLLKELKNLKSDHIQLRKEFDELKKSISK